MVKPKEKGKVSAKGGQSQAAPLWPCTTALWNGTRLMKEVMRKLFLRRGRCNRCAWPNRVLLPQGTVLVVLKVVKFITVFVLTVCRVKKLKWWSELFFFIPRLPQQASYLVSPVWTLDGLKSSLEGKQVVKQLAGKTSPVSRLSLSTYSLTDKKMNKFGSWSLFAHS